MSFYEIIVLLTGLGALISVICLAGNTIIDYELHIDSKITGFDKKIRNGFIWLGMFFLLFIGEFIYGLFHPWLLFC